MTANKKDLSTWQDFVEVISSQPGKEVQLTVKRAGTKELIPIPVTPSIDSGQDLYGKKIQKGIIGVAPDQPLSRIWITSPESFFAKNKIPTGSLIHQINGEKSHIYGDFLNLLSKGLNGKGSVEIHYTPPLEKDQKKKIKATLKWAKGTPLLKDELENTLGFTRAGLVIEKVEKNSPADKAGLKVFDRILEVNEHRVDSIYTFNKHSFLSDKAEHYLLVERSGQKVSIKVKLTKKTRENQFGMTKTTWFLGIKPLMEFAGPKSGFKKVGNPFTAFWLAIKKTATATYMIIDGLIKLITGQLPLNMLGGPLMIAKFASESLKVGFLAFLGTVSLLSINLALINLFPIPVLDGGHLVICGIEAITRKPINKKLLGISYMIGFWLLISLIVFSLYTDIGRFGKQIIDYLTGLFG